MTNIVIVGAGQIGSRHLQGLSLSKKTKNIDVIDPSQRALTVAKERWEQISSDNRIKVNFRQEYNDLSNHYDVGIIATCSKYRLQALKDLTNCTTVKNIVLEKFLFSSIIEYQIAQQILINNQISAWVNCPNRMMPIYKKIKELSKKEERLLYSVTGAAFGLACNSIHYFDLFSFLTGHSNMEIKGTLLDKECKPSKRDQYIEYFGGLIAKADNGSIMTVNCIEGDHFSVSHSITGKKLRAFYDEEDGILKYNCGDGWNEEVIPLSFQSQLSGLFVDQILEEGTSELPTYNESSQLHQSILNVLLTHQHGNQYNDKTVCPIT